MATVSSVLYRGLNTAGCANRPGRRCLTIAAARSNYSGCNDALRRGATAAIRRRLASSESSSAAAATSSGAAAASAEAERRAAREAQRRAYEHCRKKSEPTFPFNLFRSGRGKKPRPQLSVHDRNVRIASYAAAAVIGALGATYASVPLYKMFCQATGFGGTTQRVTLTEWAEKQEEREETGQSKISQALWDRLKSMSNVPDSMLPQTRGASHGRGGPRTWTDEEAAERLASLKPVKDGRLITVRFDSTIGDVMPWSFVPTQLDVKVVPGETALSFFTAHNKHPTQAITGVATYNVHPPRAGLYFNKIQCFCFEEQRLLPGETVDMPVFFFIDPEYANDPQLARCNNITLSYTFFQTDMDDDDDEDEEEEEEDRGNEKEKGADSDRAEEEKEERSAGAGSWIRRWWRGQ